MRSVRTLLITSFAVLALVLGTGVANADSRVYQGNDFAETIYSGDTFIRVCDREADGNGVWTDYYTGKRKYYKLWDANGSKSGCSGVDLYTWTWVHHYRVCENRKGCSRWFYTGQGLE